jgi:hypothetical protein
MHWFRQAAARRLGVVGATAALVLLATAASPVAAASTSFGAKLDSTSQPSNAEGGQTCDENANIPTGSKCTWLSVQAYRNGPTGNRAIAPKTGHVNKLKLVTCVAGSFQLQFAHRKSPTSNKAKIVTNGPKINYAADPFVDDGNPDTFCGGDDGIYTVQTFTFSPITVHKGDYIAVKTRSIGTLYCSGGSGIKLYAPPLTTSGYATARTSASCNLLVQVFYGG